MPAASRLDAVLMAAEDLLRSARDHDQALAELGFRIFRLGLAFIDAVDAGQLCDAWLRERLPPDMHESRTLANYGALVRARVAGWFEGTHPATFTRTIDTPDGSRLASELLHDLTERAAQCLRALHALAGRECRATTPARPEGGGSP